MKKLKARKEREQQESVVRPRIEIEDPSAELIAGMRSWNHDDPLPDSFLEQSQELESAREFHRLPRMRFCTMTDSSLPTSEPTPIPVDHSIRKYEAGPEVVVGSCPKESYMAQPPPIPERHSSHTKETSTRYRAQSLPPARDIDTFSFSPPKANFLLFSQRCAPSPASPASPAPAGDMPLFELSAEEAAYSMVDTSPVESIVELEGSPVEQDPLEPAPLHIQKLGSPELEPEASPYSRFATFTKSIHALNANLSPIEETEEEAASRRSSLAQQVHELPLVVPRRPLPPSAYLGGVSIAPRHHRYTIGGMPDLGSAPTRNTSTRSTNSTGSTNSMHSVFSFEYANSDAEKIFTSTTADRRKSSAPSLTDVSSDDEFDIDLDLISEERQSRTLSKRDAKLERFFGIRQYSIGSESDSSLALESAVSPTSPTATFQVPLGAHTHNRPSVSIDDLDLSLALENDPYKRDIMTMHRSLLSKTQSKQDAKLEKFFGCAKDEIQVARQSSTGSRLAGCTDDLKYRSMAW